MGGKNKKQTIGYKYFMGLHAVLCQTGIDAILELRFGDRVAWRGRSMDQAISVSKPRLFGGKKKEGGVSGYINVMSGRSTQTVNDYLAAKLGGDLIPAFRGVTSMVFRGFYFGNNPYIKPWMIKAQNVFSTFGSWLPQFAPVNEVSTRGGFALWIALDNSGSMLVDNKLQIAKNNINAFLDTLPIGAELPVSVTIRIWDEVVVSTVTVNNVQTQDNINTLKTAVNSAGGTGGFTNFDTAISGANTFFNGTAATVNSFFGGVFARLTNSALDTAGAFSGGIAASVASQSGESGLNQDLEPILVFITDGAPTGDSLQDAIDLLDDFDRTVAVFGVNINDVGSDSTAQLVRNGGQLVIVDGGSETQLAAALTSAVSSDCDLNGVHIMRDVLVNPLVNGNGDPDSIGESFAPAAETAFGENMGFSFFHKNPSDREGFKKLVDAHINSETYLDVATGKWEIKLIRPDYTVGDLTTFDRSIITDWTSPPVTPRVWEQTNQLTLIYTNRENGKNASVTLSNIAAIQSNSGRIINEKVEMLGVTTPELANVIAQRELQARSLPITRGGFRSAYCPAGLNRGSAIIVNEPRVGINNMVCRITELEEPDGQDNSVLIRFATDVWSIAPSEGAFAVVDAAEPITYDPLPSPFTLAIELPYYDLVQRFGDVQAIDLIAADPDLGYWGAAATDPGSNHINAQIAVLDPADSLYTYLADAPFMPSFALTSALTGEADDTSFTSEVNGFEAEVLAGELLYIGDEIVRVDNITIAGTTVTWTVGRGCLDTVPVAHNIGSLAVDWSAYLFSDGAEYTVSDEVTAKVSPATRTGPYSLALTQANTITFAARANSPYPVGRLQVDSAYMVPDGVTGTITATWTHRDRVFQTSGTVEDHTAASIGPETDVEYIPFMRFYGTYDDVFDQDVDVFAVEDVFLDPTQFTEQTYVLGDLQALTYDFDLTEPDVFDLSTDVFNEDVDVFRGCFPVDLASVSVGVRTVRGTSPLYTNYQEPELFFQPLVPAILTAEVV